MANVTHCSQLVHSTVDGLFFTFQMDLFTSVEILTHTHTFFIWSNSHLQLCLAIRFFFYWWFVAILRERKIYMLNAFDNNADRLTKYVIVCIVFEIVLNCNHSLEMRDAWKTNFTCHLQMDENFRFSKHLNLASINKPLFYRYVILRHCVRISHSPHLRMFLQMVVFIGAYCCENIPIYSHFFPTISME